MTADELRAMKYQVPFRRFTIHMSDGRKLVVNDPDSLVVPKAWQTDAIMMLPRAGLAFIHIPHVKRVSSGGQRGRGPHRTQDPRGPKKPGSK